MLHTEPSFCIYADEDGSLDNEKGELGTKSPKQLDSGGFTFAETNMGLIVEDEEDDRSIGFKNLGIEDTYTEDHEQMQPLSPKMYLATGFGIDGIGGTEFNPATFNESGDIEEYCKMMASQDPCNPLFLTNYAKLLQSKGDLTGAEDYFEKAVLFANGDCDILAAYACFLWEIDEDCQHGGLMSCYV